MKKITKVLSILAVAALLFGCNNDADEGKSDCVGTQQGGGNTGNGNNNNTDPAIYDLPANVGTDELKGITFYDDIWGTKWEFNDDGTLSYYFESNHEYELEKIYSYSYDSTEKTYSRKPYKMDCSFLFYDEDDLFLTYDEAVDKLESVYDEDYAKEMYMDMVRDEEASKFRDMLNLTSDATEDEILAALIEYSKVNYELMNLEAPITTWSDVAKSVLVDYIEDLDRNYKTKETFKYEISETGISFIPLVTSTNLKDYIKLKESGNFYNKNKDVDLVMDYYRIELFLNDTDTEYKDLYINEVKDNVIELEYYDFNLEDSITVELSYTVDFTKPQGEKTISIDYKGETYTYVQCMEPEVYSF